MRKNTFCLLIALLAPLQLFGSSASNNTSSSSNNQSIIQAETKNVSQEKFILDFLKHNPEAKVNVGYISSCKAIEKCINRAKEGQRRSIEPLLSLLKPCDPKDAYKRVAQYQASIKAINIETLPKKRYVRRRKYAEFKRFAKALYKPDVYLTVRLKDEKILGAYKMYNHQMREHNINFIQADAQKTIENYYKQRIECIKDNLNESLKFREEFLKYNKEMIDNLAKKKPKYEKKLREIKRLQSVFPIDNQSSSSDSSSSDSLDECMLQ